MVSVLDSGAEGPGSKSESQRLIQIPRVFTRRPGRRVGPVKVFLTLCDCVSFATVVKL